MPAELAKPPACQQYGGDGPSRLPWIFADADGTDPIARAGDPGPPMKNPLRLRFVRDVAMTGGAQGIQAICAMLGGILVARFLGPEAKGQLTVLVALGAMAVLLASLGVHQSAIYFLGRHKDERDAIVSNNTLFALCGAVVTTALLAALGVTFHDQLLSGVPLTLFFAYLLAVPFNYVTEFVRRT